MKDYPAGQKGVILCKMYFSYIPPGSAKIVFPRARSRCLRLRAFGHMEAKGELLLCGIDRG